MASLMRYLTLAVMVFPIAVVAQTNLDVAWHVCEGHGKLIGKASGVGPARWVFQPGYSGCEKVQKLIPTEKPEAIDPNKAITDQMLIGRALANPAGKPQ